MDVHNKDYLAQLLVRSKIESSKCPFCEKKVRLYYLGKKFKCSKCRKIFSIRKNTIFQNSKLPLTKWFAAIKYLSSENGTLSSTKLADKINITQKTAWLMIKKMKSTKVIHEAKTKKLNRISEKEELIKIRHTILKTKVRIPGSSWKKTKDWPKNQKDYLKRFKSHVKYNDFTKKRKSSFEAAIERAINIKYWVR